MNDSNVDTEMSSLVRNAQEWVVGSQGLDHMPACCRHDPRLQRIQQGIVTRAGFRLMEQMGIKKSEEFHQFFGNSQKCEKNVEEPRVEELPVSPMSLDEFNNIMKNGWPSEQKLPSPLGAQRRSSIFNGLTPISPITADETVQEEPPKIFKTPGRRTNVQKRHFVTSTPANDRRSLLGIQTENRTPALSRATPFTPAPITGEGPMENKASRLRRMKTEEKKRMSSGFDKNCSGNTIRRSFQ